LVALSRDLTVTAWPALRRTRVIQSGVTAAGGDSELAVWPRMFHVWHAYWPRLADGAAAIEQIADFIRRQG